MNAVPIPWMTLENNSSSLLKEKQEMITPIMVTIIPMNNDLLSPYLLVNFPKGIDNAAIASKKMVATQFWTILLIASSRAMRGRATEMLAKNAVTNETTAASRITDFSKPNLLTIPT